MRLFLPGVFSGEGRNAISTQGLTMTAAHGREAAWAVVARVVNRSQASDVEALAHRALRRADNIVRNSSSFVSAGAMTSKGSESIESFAAVITDKGRAFNDEFAIGRICQPLFLLTSFGQ